MADSFDGLCDRFFIYNISFPESDLHAETVFYLAL